MNRYKGIGILPVLCMLVVLFNNPVRAIAQPMTPVPDWHAWHFLMGEWIGDGNGEPGQGAGGFSFSIELQGRILVRHNYANYPATKDRPAFRHNDLMVIYKDAGSTKADYFDNEGHVIHYLVDFSGDSSSIIFISAESDSEPRYRLTYAEKKGDTLSLSFDIAPPAKPEEFRQYISAAAHKKRD